MPSTAFMMIVSTNSISMDLNGAIPILRYLEFPSASSCSQANPSLATKAFSATFVSATEHTVAAQGASFRAHIEYDEAYKRLAEFDILVVPGGSTDAIIKNKSEPLGIITAFSDLQKKNPEKERTLLSVCTGSLLLAQQGVLSGLSATTHPDYYAKFEKICSEISQRDLAERCDVVEERYVVNNLRFDLGENPDENPYVRRKSDARRPSIPGRKGSNAWKDSNRRRESMIKRAALRLGGLRVITSGGITCGLDASLYLVSIMVSEESAKEVERVMQYEWKKGIVVDGIDI
jgi:transcriptional regulator GlxA family with amidase domain